MNVTKEIWGTGIWTSDLVGISPEYKKLKFNTCRYFTCFCIWQQEKDFVAIVYSKQKNRTPINLAVEFQFTVHIISIQ